MHINNWKQMFKVAQKIVVLNFEANDSYLWIIVHLNLLRTKIYSSSSDALHIIFFFFKKPRPSYGCLAGHVMVQSLYSIVYIILL